MLGRSLVLIEPPAQVGGQAGAKPTQSASVSMSIHEVRLYRAAEGCGQAEAPGHYLVPP